MASDVDPPSAAGNASQWASDSRRFINELLLKEKEAQSKSIHVLEEQQRLNLKLARGVLGASSDQPLSHRGTLTARSPEADGANSGSDCDAGGGRGSPRSLLAGRVSPGPSSGSSASSFDISDSHSQIPKLPPLATDTGDGAAADGANIIGATTNSSRSSGGASQRSSCELPHGVHGAASVKGGAARSRTFTTGPRASQQALSGSPSRRSLSHPRPSSEGSPAPMRASPPGPALASSHAAAASKAGAAAVPSAAAPSGPSGGGGGGRSSSSKLYGTFGLPATPGGYAQWRARMKVPQGRRVFCIAGSGGHSSGIRTGLLERGWYENPDHNSPFYDFKWAANPLDISHETLWGGQVVNHFRHATCLTTKHGLCHTVRDLAWYEAADAAAFYPRAYDISDENSRRDFLRDVRWTAAECLIKRALLDGAVASAHVPRGQQPAGRKGAAGGGGGGGGGGAGHHQRSHAQSHTQSPHPQQGAAGSSAAQSGSQQKPRKQRATSGAAAAACASPSDDAGCNDEDGVSAAGRPDAGASADAGASEAVSGAEAAPAEGADVGGGEGQGPDSDQLRLRQRTDSTPLVDLPSLRLACRAVAARLRHHRHLRAAREGAAAAAPPAGAAAAGGGGGGGVTPRGGANAPHPPAQPQSSHPDDGDLTAAQWQQLVRHRALSCSVPLLPPPPFDPAWLTDRAFITSALLPQVPPRRGGRGGKGRRGGGRRRRRQNRAAAAAAGRRAATDDDRDSGADSDGESDADGGGGSRSAAPSDIEGGDRGVGAGPTSSEPGGVVGAATAAAVTGGSARTSGRVAVADAAELLRQAYGQRRPRRHSAPASSAMLGAAEDGDGGEAGLAASCGLADAAPAAGTGCSDADDGRTEDAAAADGAAGASWLPRALPAICYDDEALQSLDHSNWRAAAEAILGALSDSAVQTHISGVANIWIVKPAGKSRGRGIRLFNDPDALMSYVRCEEAQGLESRWIAQKYVERPLIIEGRKFDIRQWVLVTDWNPLQAWFYSTCYLRFAADDYDPNNLDVFQHLTNNSVSKYYEGPKKEDEITASGNMWSVPRFQVWLEELYGRDDLWGALLQPAMKHIAICTLKAAQDVVAPRKGSCQLYGYDFLIDDQLRVWLLEVNASPTLEASTPITAQLCAELQEDILKVVVDLPDKRAAAAAAAGADGGGVGPIGLKRRGSGAAALAAAAAGQYDTGRWECIVDGGEELRRPDYTGLSLEVKGTAIPIPASPFRPSFNPSGQPPGFVSRLHAAVRQPRLSLRQQQELLQRQQQQQRQQDPEQLGAELEQQSPDTEDAAVAAAAAAGQAAAAPAPQVRDSWLLRASTPLYSHVNATSGDQPMPPPPPALPRSPHTPFGSYSMRRAGSGGIGVAAAAGSGAATAQAAAGEGGGSGGEARVGSSGGGISPATAAAVQVYLGGGSGSPLARGRMSPARLRTPRLSNGPNAGGLGTSSGIGAAAAGGGGGGTCFVAPSPGPGALAVSWDGCEGRRFVSTPLGPPGTPVTGTTLSVWPGGLSAPPAPGPLSAVATRASLFARPGHLMAQLGGVAGHGRVR